MSRPDFNRSGEMEVFVRVVELTGFTPAAAALGLTPSAVSKLITRLESRLGARLFNRSTRRLQLTPEGQGFYRRAQQVLADLDAAEREAAGGASPRGHLRVNCNIPFGMRFVTPVIARFLETYPEVTIDLVLSDTVIDLQDERADLAIRVGPLRGSALVARKLGTSRMAIVGAPAYLARSGEPLSAADLSRHRGIGWTFRRYGGLLWPLVENGRRQDALAPLVAGASDGDVARLLTLSGLGLARLALFHVAPDIAAGNLVPVLEPLNPGDQEDIHAVYLGQPGPLPARVRAFIDFLVSSIDLPPWRLALQEGLWTVVSDVNGHRRPQKT